jgi:hypothetical protein
LRRPTTAKALLEKNFINGSVAMSDVTVPDCRNRPLPILQLGPPAVSRERFSPDSLPQHRITSDDDDTYQPRSDYIMVCCAMSNEVGHATIEGFKNQG